MSEMPECKPMSPGPEHGKLAEKAGKWNVKCTFYMDPSQPPMETTATETIEMIGPFHTVSRFESEMMGQPFTGIATTGYDMVNKEWVCTWIDTMSPGMFSFTGQYDESGQILEMKGKGPNMMSSEMADYRTTEEEIDPNHLKFEMFMNMGGQEIRLFTHEYTRA